MREKKKWVLAAGGVALAAALGVGMAQASPASGFTATTLALGRLPAFEVRNHVAVPDSIRDESARLHWLSMQRTKGSSDLYVQSNLWAPGGSTGWHTHPGHSLIIVTEGTITAYEGDDPTCRPHVYPTGSAIVDPGGDHVHVLRNETGSPARTVAVQLIPAGSTRRIDAQGPAGCADL